MLIYLLPLMLPVIPGSARAGVQSVLTPKSTGAAEIAEISWVIFIGGGLIFAVVMALAAIAVFGSPSLRSKLGRYPWIIGGGIAFPAVVLSALLVYTFATTTTIVQAGLPATMQIKVVGERWWWRVFYLDDAGKPIFETANDIRIPVGQPIEFLLTSDNVIHSFWVPNLAGKTDMIPGHVNRLAVQADEPGVFRGQCAEYCGAQHAKMAFHVGAHAPDEFSAWLAAQGKPAHEPQTPLARQGKEIFLRSACVECHTIRGTAASGRLGPDLTHVGSRLSLAAGILPNNQGTHGGWISASQQIKPGNQMPSFNHFSGDELRALAAYMESLQ